MQNKIKIAKLLLDSLPFIKKFNAQKIVIKYGGSVQNSKILQDSFTRDIVLLHTVGIKPIIVHGGGQHINSFLEKLNIQSSFINGERVTTKETLDIVEMVLSGKINKGIVSSINRNGGKSIGLSGKDANLIEATPKDFSIFKYTGVVKNINPDILNKVINNGFIPVISSFSTSIDNKYSGFNVNADLVASKIAIAINAKKIIFLTDTLGILDKNMKLLHTLNRTDIEKLIEDKVITGGMIPKVESSIDAINLGVEKAHIIDGEILHSIILELLTKDGIGSCIKN